LVANPALRVKTLPEFSQNEAAIGGGRE
jgi:hypothetical protein